jgi:hypothetical protein
MGVILRYNDFLKTYKTRGYRINHLESYKDLFPIKSNKILAGIIADLMCDGHLQGNPKWRIDFTSKSKSELKRFEGTIKTLFNKTGKIRECKTNKYGKTYNMGINCSPVARILLLCGVPQGQKVLTPFGAPEWILKDKECFRIFCKRMFSCEGSIMHEKTRRMPQVRLDMWKAESLLEDGFKFINGICSKMDRYFGIKSTITFPNSRSVRKDGIITKPIRVYILGESMLKFCDKIGFEGDKQKSLKALIPKLR